MLWPRLRNALYAPLLKAHSAAVLLSPAPRLRHHHLPNCSSQKSRLSLIPLSLAPSLQEVHLPAVLLAHPPQLGHLCLLHHCDPSHCHPEDLRSPQRGLLPLLLFLQKEVEATFLFHCKSNQISLLLETLQWLPATHRMRCKGSTQFSQPSVTRSLEHSAAQRQGPPGMPASV